MFQVCSDINKPNGQFVLQNDRSTVMTFVSFLPVRKVCVPELLLLLSNLLKIFSLSFRGFKEKLPLNYSPDPLICCVEVQMMIHSRERD
jgi:hypothetical protein